MNKHKIIPIKTEGFFSTFDQLSRKLASEGPSPELKYLFFEASDCNFSRSIQTLSEQPAETIKGKNRIGFLMGESFILSLIPALTKHCDLVIIADINPNTLKIIRFEIEAMKTAETLEKFLDIIVSEQNPAFHYFAKSYRDSKTYENWLAQEKYLYRIRANSRLGCDSFCFSPDNYKRYRLDLLRMNINYLQINIFNTRHVMRFVSSLRELNSCITVYNVTNLFDYLMDEELKEKTKQRCINEAIARTEISMERLPFSDQPLILYSKFVYMNRSNGSMGGSSVVRSVKRYFDENITWAQRFW